MEFGTTVSTCRANLARGNQIFLIPNYHVNMESGIGNFNRSQTFQVGGYDWSLKYYPDGINRQSRKYVSVLVELMTENSEVRAMFSFRLNSLVGQYTEWKGTGVLRLSSAEGNCRIGGCNKFMEKKLLEAEIIRFGRFSMEWSVSVLKDPVVTHSDLLSAKVKLPPPMLSDDFTKLLESKEGADVTFYVQGESFPAHRAVLAARSHVFRVQLCGPMKDEDGSSITVEDMLSDVFRALLHFVYTNCLVLPFDGIDNNGRKEIIRHLLGAADRYAVRRLKLTCESILCKCIDVETVVSTYALADQHHCKFLKEVCLKFMASPTIISKVVDSQDYVSLKGKSASLALEILESVCKFPKV